MPDEAPVMKPFYPRHVGLKPTRDDVTDGYVGIDLRYTYAVLLAKESSATVATRSRLAIGNDMKRSLVRYWENTIMTSTRPRGVLDFSVMRNRNGMGCFDAKRCYKCSRTAVDTCNFTSFKKGTSYAWRDAFVNRFCTIAASDRKGFIMDVTAVNVVNSILPNGHANISPSRDYLRVVDFEVASGTGH
jgi:hypothetical protein